MTKRTSSIDSFLGILKGKTTTVATIEEMNQAASAGWASEAEYEDQPTSPERFTPYDPANSLTTEEDIAVFLADATETGNTQYIALARKIAARARFKNKQRDRY
ncbi:hypothetical protein [Bordetella sp. 02P26C-1]|uniref:hypothetical protein n=1 Tax=Bordetella sp. 02P26C-1 TaxID=2683195 RepID=UPI001354B05E|nr:hypothetical protein [Bordetella sp. 02P26C-1]MVW78079.1 hypothetical protein [Bordetella sp. 02P26C-1]